MTETVVIETEASFEKVRKALPEWIELEQKGEDIHAYVYKERDPEEKVTELLNDAGIKAYVYQLDPSLE